MMLFAPSSSFIGHPYQHDNLPYKPDDLAPIARVPNTVIGRKHRVDPAMKAGIGATACSVLILALILLTMHTLPVSIG
jgi:hypothetical protein